MTKTPKGIIDSRRRAIIQRARKGGKLWQFDPEHPTIYRGNRRAMLGCFGIVALDCLRYEHGWRELEVVAGLSETSAHFIEDMAVEWAALTPAEVETIRSGELTLENFAALLGVSK